VAKKQSEKPPLTLVTSEMAGSAPPRNLGKHGRSLWDRITSENDVSDAAGIELLAQACAAADLAEQLQAEVDRDGPITRARGVVKAHPAIKEVIACRSFVCRVLTKLGLNFEPLRSTSGRPGSGLGWTGER
jgi:hypothetical protein